MEERQRLQEKLFEYIIKDEWKAFETGNKILKAIRKQYESDEEREAQLYQVQTEMWQMMKYQYPWIVQFEEVDCSVNPPDLGWGMFCYLEVMTNISKKYHLAQIDKTAEKIINTLLKNLCASGTVMAASDELGMDKQKLNRCLKKKMGISANEYCNMLKIKYAAKMIKSTEEEIAVVAKKMGYQSAESFIRKFKEEIGCRPEQYRKVECA